MLGYAYPDGRQARMIANPIRVAGEVLPQRAAPELGADTDALLAELGYDKANIEVLKRDGVVR